MLESASRATNRELVRIKKRLDEMYSIAAKEIREKADKYTASFYALDEKKRALVASGRMTKEAYRDWREQKVFVGARWRTLEMELAERLANTDKAAIAYVNGRLPSVYTTNYNALARGVNGLGVGVRFDLVNEHTIKYLATTDKTLLPYKTVNGKKAERWHTQRVNAEVAQGILQGESMQEIAKRLEQNVGMTAEGSAMRNAKLAVGSAQNKGRMDMMLDMEKKGLVVKKRWTTIHDTRTRDAHIELDGVEQDLHKPFVNSIGEIDYPKSPDAAPANVYNCRCEIITHIMGVRNPETGAYTDLSGIQTFRNPPFPQKAKPATQKVKKVAPVVAIQKVYDNAISRIIGQDDYKKYREKLDMCANDDVKTVYEAFADNIGVISTTQSSAYESSKRIAWNNKADLAGSKLRKPMSVFFHETGHANDEWLNVKINGRSGMFSTSWENGRFPKAIRQEVDDWISAVDAKMKAEFKAHKADYEWLKLNGFISRAMDTELNWYSNQNGVPIVDILSGKHKITNSYYKAMLPKYRKDYAYSAIEKELREIRNGEDGDYKIHALSDIVGGVTKKKIDAGWGHSKSYWDRQDPAVEAFAEMSEAYVTGPESLETLRKFLPNSVAVFDEMMKYARGIL